MKPGGADLPNRARVGNRREGVDIDPRVYFDAVRMEQRGILKRGQALMLAATLKKPHTGAKISRPAKGK